MCRSSSESLTNTGTITWTSLYSQYSAGAWSCLGTGPSHETARKACPHVRAHPQPPSASSAPSLPALRAALKSGKIHLRAQATAAQASDEGTSGEVACVGGGQRWPTHLTGSASSGSSGDDRSRARSSAIVPPQAERPSLRAAALMAAAARARAKCGARYQQYQEQARDGASVLRRAPAVTTLLTISRLHDVARRASQVLAA